MTFSSPQDQSQILSGAIAQEMGQHIIHHSNISQETILITEDRVRLCLLKHMERVSKKTAWQTPTAILITLIVTIVTTNTKDSLGLPASTWEAVFLLGAVLAGIWLATTVLHAFTRLSIEDIVAEMKRTANQVTSTQHDPPHPEAANRALRRRWARLQQDAGPGHNAGPSARGG